MVRIFGGILADPNKARRTQVQQRAGLNYSLFTRYLNFLTERDLVRLLPEDDGGDRLELTPRGHDAYRFIGESLDRLLGSLRT